MIKIRYNSTHKSVMLITKFGDVAKLVDALDLGSSGATCESSSLSDPTIYKNLLLRRVFCYVNFEIGYMAICLYMIIDKEF